MARARVVLKRWSNTSNLQRPGVDKMVAGKLFKVRVHVCIAIYMHIYNPHNIHTDVHIHINKYVHAYVHIHTHTHLQLPTPSCLWVTQNIYIGINNRSLQRRWLWWFTVHIHVRYCWGSGSIEAVLLGGRFRDTAFLAPPLRAPGLGTTHSWESPRFPLRGSFKGDIDM